jgi:PII-like signaling protein
MNGQPGKLLRVYVNEHHQYGGKPLYEAIVDRCRQLNVAGVTVFRALEGFGETAELHHQHLFRSDQPIVITIVERPEKAQQILPVLESMMNSGLIAVTDVEVTFVSNGARTALP